MERWAARAEATRPASVVGHVAEPYGPPPPLQTSTPEERKRLLVALVLSLLAHALLFTIEVDGTLGWPGFDFPWQERRVEAPDLRVVLNPVQPEVTTPPPRPVVAPARPAAPKLARRPAPIDRAPPPAKQASTAVSNTVVVPAVPEVRPSSPRAADESPPPPSIDAPAPEGPAPTTERSIIAVDRPDDAVLFVPPTPLEPQSTMPRREAATTQHAEIASLDALRSGMERQQAEQRDAERRRVARAEAERVEAERVATLALEDARRDDERRRAEQAARAQASKDEAERREAASQEAAREAARIEAARLEAERDEASRIAAAKADVDRQQAARDAAEQARAEAQRAATEREEGARQQAARDEAARREASAQDAARRDAAQAEAARVDAERQAAARTQATTDEERREAILRKIGRQLDAEAKQRAAQASNPSIQREKLPYSLSTPRRGRLWGRADPNAELVAYAEAMGRKIQFNTPPEVVYEVAKHPHTDPLVTIAIRSDGSVESVKIELSSGSKEVDDAIRRIVQSHEHYLPFSPNLARDYDVIEIRRTWTFDGAVRLF